MEDKQSKIQIGGSVGGSVTTGKIEGDSSSHVGGNVSFAINELPSSSEPDKPGIKELLTQLQAAIKADLNLSDDDKKEASQQIKIIAEAGKNPNEGEMKKLAKKATTMLKGIIVGLPAAAKLAEEWNNILPLIAKAFGF
ncbi:hypothetical protein [Microcoleus sp. EPA2]|uniref:hypothetical protein n=1 Tax=Microcoleus sp. EPA2 TaxID=2841654 RepID=UPI00312B957A